jgi:hypothetical protein
MQSCSRKILCWSVALSVSFAFLSFSRLVQATDAEKAYLNFFSVTYEEARNKFLQSAEAAGARIESYQHPLAGPDGLAMYTDIALIGPEDAETVLVLGSGTHGVEGFAGSAVQVGLLQEGINQRIPSDLRLVMIHAINPYGFAHRRRVNEDNVDLNRNFVDHSAPYPNNPGYEALADVAAPKLLSFWENTKVRLKLYWYRLKEGKSQLRRAISQGQFSHPEGLFYGGKLVTWSNTTLSTTVKKHLSSARRVMFIDFHTGLGGYGDAEVIMNVSKESPAYGRAKSCWDEQVRTTVEGESVSVHISGSLKLAIPKMLPQAEVTAVSLEFGTFSVSDVFWALRAENWLHHYGGDAHPKKEKIKSELLRVFYPKDNAWKRAVWEKGRSVVDKSLICMRKE